jgi:hypothetical protein
MATIKISELPALTNVNSDSEIPVVQGGVTYSSTVADIVSSANPIGELKIIADGSIGGPISPYVSLAAAIPANTNGTTIVPYTTVIDLQFDANSSNIGSPFTATTLSFPEVETAGNLSVINTTTLTSLSAPSLKYITNSLNFYSNANLATLNVSSLISSNAILFGGTPYLTTYNFPNLVTCSSGLSIQYPNHNLTGFRQSMFPSLRKSGFNIGYDSLSSFVIDFPLLTTLTSFGGSTSVNLTNFNCPALVTITPNLGVYYYSNLTNLILGAVGVTKNWGNATNNTPYCRFTNNALTQTSVDNILLVMASLDGTNGTTLNANGYLQLNGGTNATPSAAGLAAKSTLISRGFTVSNN